jgi:hypothetical protein
VAFFVVSCLFWAWVLFLGGAEWLEGSWLAGLLVHVRAPEVSAEGIKVIAALLWLFEVVWSVLGLFDKDLRF